MDVRSPEMPPSYPAGLYRVERYIMYSICEQVHKFLVVVVEVLLALLPRSWIIAAYCPNPVDPPYSVGDNTPGIIYIYVQYMYVYVCVCTVKAIYS
jgi:hypothetical protein